MWKWWSMNGFGVPRLGKVGIQMWIDRVTSDGWPCGTRSLVRWIWVVKCGINMYKPHWTWWIFVGAGQTSLFDNVWIFSWMASSIKWGPMRLPLFRPTAWSPRRIQSPGAPLIVIWNRSLKITQCFVGNCWMKGVPPWPHDKRETST